MIDLAQPNFVQDVRLAWTEPSKDNCRLFVEQESLESLRAIYRRHRRGEIVVLPDPPILRFLGWQPDPEHNCDGCGGDGWAICPQCERVPKLEVLAGERRLTAAFREGLEELPCRVVTMDDEEAYRFLLDHNDVAGLTTAELAFRAAEMDRLGFTEAEVSGALRGAEPYRYIQVGYYINPDEFTDTVKLCNPSITEWYEASRLGLDHFTRCFRAWDNGVWDAETCAREFRQRGRTLPLDNAERGFRITLNGGRLVVRGQVDLNYVDEKMAARILDEVQSQLGYAARLVRQKRDFGPRSVSLINPETVETYGFYQEEEEGVLDEEK